MEGVSEAMIPCVAVDTHIILWVYDHKPDRISAPARRALERAFIAVPAFVWLEIALLAERGRLHATPDQVKAYIEGILRMRILSADIADVCRAASPITWTRDPFDRLIVAEAQLHAIPLVTKDRLIRAHYKLAVW